MRSHAARICSAWAVSMTSDCRFEVQPAGRRADVLRDRSRKRDHVVPGLSLDFSMRAMSKRLRCRMSRAA